DHRPRHLRPSRRLPPRAALLGWTRYRVPQVRAGPHGDRAAIATSALGRLEGQRLAAAREPAYGGETPVGVPPGIRLRDQRVVRDLVDDEPARLAAPVRAGLPEAGGDRDGDAALAAGDDLELAPLAHRSLVDVAREHELRARVDERRQHVVPACDRLLA